MDMSNARRIVSADGFRLELIRQLDIVYGQRSNWVSVSSDGVLCFDSSTWRWNEAVRITCERLGHKHLGEWYDALPLDEVDMFDAFLENVIIGVPPFEGDDMI